MNMWRRIVAACRDQRGELNFGGVDLPDFLSLPDPMQTSVGPALSFGGGTGPGGSDWLNTLSGYAEKALPLLKLGTQGLGAFSGIEGMIHAGQQQKYLNTAQKSLQQASAPALAAGQQLIPAGTQALMGGPLPPQLETTVNNWIAGEKAKYRQAFAHMGITDSTMMAEADSAIEAQAQTLRAQLAQGLLSGGQGVSGQAIQAAGLGGQLAANQQNTVAQALSQADQAMARLLGASA